MIVRIKVKGSLGPNWLTVLLFSPAYQMMSWRDSIKNETVMSALARLDDEIVKSEKAYPTARLSVVTAEIDSIQQVNISPNPDKGR